MRTFVGFGSVFLILFIASTATAQIEPGKMRISAGVVGFERSRMNLEDDFDMDGNSTSFQAVPGGDLTFGFAPTQRFELGVTTALTRIDIDPDGAARDSGGWSFGVGPYMAWNLPLNRSRTLTMGPQVGVAYRRVDTRDFESNQAELSFGPQMKWFVADSASIDLGFLVSLRAGRARLSNFAGTDESHALGYTFGPRISISIWP